MEDFRPKIIAEFTEMKKREYAQGERFKVMAYTRAIEALEQLGKPVTTVSDVVGVKNIGKKSIAKIEEIIRTGQLQKAREAQEDPQVQAINQLAKIHGIGMVKARELVLENGIDSLDRLKRRPELLNDVQKIGLKYYEDLKKRIPRFEMEMHQNYLIEKLQEVANKLGLSNDRVQGQVVGSYRRNAIDSGDVDFLISEEGGDIRLFTKFVQKLFEDGYLEAKLAQGPFKFNGVCCIRSSNGEDFGHNLYRRIDILFSPPEEYPFALFYFTGSKLFNTEVRQFCKDKGYSLNEKNLSIGDTEVKVQKTFRTEIDIFRFLGLEWVEPKNRTSGVLKECIYPRKIIIKKLIN